jgi:hypothetical protein
MSPKLPVVLCSDPGKKQNRSMTGGTLYLCCGHGGQGCKVNFKEVAGQILRICALVPLHPLVARFCA